MVSFCVSFLSILRLMDLEPFGTIKTTDRLIRRVLIDPRLRPDVTVHFGLLNGWTWSQHTTCTRGCRNAKNSTASFLDIPCMKRVSRDK